MEQRDLAGAGGARRLDRLADLAEAGDARRDDQRLAGRSRALDERQVDDLEGCDLVGRGLEFLQEIDRRLNFGSAELDYSWVHDQFHDGHSFTSPVREYPANEQGLHDMVGNVWCWSFTPTADFGRRPNGDRQASVTKLEKLGVNRNVSMAMHGGCYLARLTHVTLFAKMGHPALDGAEDIGFRLVAVRAREAGVPLRNSDSKPRSTP